MCWRKPQPGGVKNRAKPVELAKTDESSADVFTAVKAGTGINRYGLIDGPNVIEGG
jgi:hypothetical protein